MSGISTGGSTDCNTANCPNGKEVHGQAGIGSAQPTEKYIIAQMHVSRLGEPNTWKAKGKPKKVGPTANVVLLPLSMSRCRITTTDAVKCYRLVGRGYIVSESDSLRYFYPGFQCKCNGFAMCGDKDGVGGAGSHYSASLTVAVNGRCDVFDDNENLNRDCTQLALLA
jgi:hypothetical protein